MKNARVVCIDFGSAYTKIAVRPDWDEPAQLIRDVPLAGKDTSFCIPSVVAHVERGEGVRWLAGEAAAGQRPGNGVTIHRHWKARLFSERQQEQGVNDPLGHGQGVYHEVGVAFFKEIRDTLRQMALSVNIDKCPVRLCIPRLGNDEEARRRMAAILKEAGWRSVENRPTVYEPESNVCGVFTRGRNATWFPPRTRTIGSRITR